MRELARSALPLLLATNGFRLVVLLDRAVASDLQPRDVAVLRYAFFFLMVGDNGASEGSYGSDGDGSERPSDDLLMPPACPLPQDLPNRCD